MPEKKIILGGVCMCVCWGRVDIGEGSLQVTVRRGCLENQWDGDQKVPIEFGNLEVTDDCG